MSDQSKTRRKKLEEFVAKNPNDAFSRYGLAMACMREGDHSAADGHFRQLAENHPDYVPAYLMYAQMLVQEKRQGEAKSVLASGIAAAARQGNQHARSEMEALLAAIG